MSVHMWTLLKVNAIQQLSFFRLQSVNHNLPNLAGFSGPDTGQPWPDADQQKTLMQVRARISRPGDVGFRSARRAAWRCVHCTRRPQKGYS
jgi:hypothetical protein